MGAQLSILQRPDCAQCNELGALFRDPNYRHPLMVILELAHPSVFGCIMQLNKYCRDEAKALINAKQTNWLSLVPTLNRNWYNQSYKHNGRYHGVFREWVATKGGLVLVEKALLNNGVYIGARIGWYRNGCPRYCINYNIDGIRNGFYREWHQNGVMFIECIYDNGVISDYREWCAGGNLIVNWSFSEKEQEEQRAKCRKLNRRRAYIALGGMSIEDKIRAYDPKEAPGISTVARYSDAVRSFMFYIIAGALSSMIVIASRK